MSTAIKKAANYSPMELLLLSSLAGGAGFGGMRLLTDLSHQLNPPQPPSNKIPLQLANPVAGQPNPEEETPNMFQSSPINKMSEAGDLGEVVPPTAVPTSNRTPWWANPLAIAAGLPLGFMGTKALYDSYQSSQGDQRIEEAKKKYQQQLQLAQMMNSGNNKIASATPCVDSLCEGIAAELEKSADILGVDPAEIASRIMPGSNDPAMSNVSTSGIYNTFSEPSEEARKLVAQRARQGLAGIGNAGLGLVDGSKISGS